MIEMRARGLQVLDLKAAGTLSSSGMTGATCTRSHTNMLALPCMHHAPSDWRSASTRQDSLTDMNPLTTRAGSLSNVARHRPRCAAAARCSESSAAATEKAATAHHRGRLRCSESTLGTLERCQQPLSANPGGLLLVTDTLSAGADGTVVWNVIRMRLGSRNTCNVKSVLTRST